MLLLTIFNYWEIVECDEVIAASSTAVYTITYTRQDCMLDFSRLISRVDDLSTRYVIYVFILGPAIFRHDSIVHHAAYLCLGRWVMC